MKTARCICFLIPILLLQTVLFAQGDGIINADQQGYEIKIKLKPYKNEKIYLGHYFGREYPIIDSVTLNGNGEGVFRGKDKLPGGMYIVYYPGQPGYFDFLVDKQQHFSMDADISNPHQEILQFRESAENELHRDYKKFMILKQGEMIAAEEQFANAVNKKDSIAGLNKLDEIDKLIQGYRQKIIRENPNTFLSALLKPMRGPEMRQKLRAARSAADTAAEMLYNKKHYWDNIDFSDGRLAYTTFFSEKVDMYFAEVAEKESDSVIREINWMLGFASPSQKMTHFLLKKFLDASIDHSYKWDDPVFIHLFEKYIAPVTYSWLSEDARKKISERAYYLMGKMVGSAAFDISLPSKDGRPIVLSAVEADYTLICFWDPTCSHCKELLPSLDSLYRAKLKKQRLKIFAVAMETDGTREDWLNFIRDNQLEEWTHVYNSIDTDRERAIAGEKGFARLYDVWYYPGFFLLDKDKKFIAKKLPYPKLVELLETIMH